MKTNYSKYRVLGIKNNIAHLTRGSFEALLDGADGLAVGEHVELPEHNIVTEGQLKEYELLWKQYDR